MGELPEQRDLNSAGMDSISMQYRPGVAGSISSLNKKNRGKHVLGGPMNHDEIKMNRELLKQISLLKK